MDAAEKVEEKVEEAVSQRLVRAENTTRPKHMYEDSTFREALPKRGLSGVNAVIKDPEKFRRATNEHEETRGRASIERAKKLAWSTGGGLLK